MNSLRVAELRVRGRDGFVLGPLSFSVPDGALLCVLGATGSGKTLLLFSLAGLVDAQGARTAPAPVALQFQRDALVDDESVFENVASAARARGLADADVRARDALSRVGLHHKEESAPRSLSGGQRRRVGLARALAVDAPLLLLDDPTAGLDPHTAREVSAAFAPRAGRITVVATHDVDGLARAATHTLLLDQGRAVCFWARDEGALSDALPPDASAAFAPFAPRAAQDKSAELPW